jgi:membrane-associated phospholipid phosphatase
MPRKKRGLVGSEKRLTFWRAVISSIAVLIWAVAAPPSTMTLEPAREAPKPAPEIYRLHLAVDIPVSLVGGALGLARTIWRDDLARKSCPCDPASLNALDRRAVGNHNRAADLAASVTAWGLLGVLPALDLVDVGANRAFVEDLVVFAETAAIDTGIQNIVNFAVARPRPLAYANDPTFLNSGEGYLSFYAGHVATAFSAMAAGAFTVSRRHGARVWPWLATLVVGGSVAVERVVSGHHFPTDVTAAALAGTAIGITIPWLHLAERSSPVTLGPSTLGPGLALHGRF